MDILLYLSELLRQQNSIGLTNLGTFCKKKFAGRYDKEKQSFLPPGYTLQFTSEVKDEGLLAKHIAEKRNISVESAEYYISKFVEETNNKLEVEHEAELENIGRLFFTEHEGLSFEPAENITLGSKYYGLPKVIETQPSEDNPDEEKNLNTTEKLDAEEVNADEQVYDEIAEAPTHHQEEIKTEKPLPEIENIELDEVRDDLKNTLANSKNVDEVEVPEFIKEQHEEHPNRFGHQPESEEPKTFINLEDDNIEVQEPVVQAPEFIKEQHAEHPNRFGHDPLIDDAVVEEEKSVWPKIWIGIIILIIIAAITYFAKPEWFGQQKAVNADSTSVKKDTAAAVIPMDSVKLKQDSIAKTDSILKANQVGKTIDSVKKTQAVGVKPPSAVKAETATVVNAANSTFDVIAASFQSENKAKVFIKQMERYGLKAKIANLPGKLKKVSIASFKTEAEARIQRPELAKKIKIKELDIIQVNNTP
ncbi:hypothetical protein QWY86_09620 [Pedobacter aquatilis]|uniref:hypothetical protein n=1 Tax=Pedobacter aquatilis TaxID=351343 RepID=UPI0025B4A0C5|nr:hypothetical protein [Pedobacter aquatilis]MDN3586926.1 hypothetical protein [Pedobacter aquatilis]